MPLEDIRNERIKKLEILRQSGVDPYPAQTRRTHSIGEVLKKFTAFEKTKKKVAIAGRMTAKREHGGSTFIDLRDESGKIQAYFKKDVLSEEYDLFSKTIDIGDFLEIEGRLFKTKRKEETVEVTRWMMLVKTLRPLPEKWHGLQDVEERFRKRYLDLLINEGVKRRFETRSKIIHVVREFFEKENFLSVETPALHAVPGGALARPFKTHHNALDIDLYLRIALELHLKRLLVGGFERVYEIGIIFRNEGIDAEHNPEFTMLESYAAYWDENDMMDFVEHLMVLLGKTFAKKQSLEFEGKKIVLRKPFVRISFKDLLKRYALVDYDDETRDSLATCARQLGLEVEKHESKGKIGDEIYKKICRPRIVNPTFVVDHPIEISPLAKQRAKQLEEVRRFQLIVGGMEVMNGFAELNDPSEQRKRFEKQEELRSGGEEEAHRVDEDFLEALEYGMPPAAGLGIGIDRLVMLFTNTRNIREVVLFPTLKPK